MPKQINQTIIYFSIISIIAVFALVFLVQAGAEHNTSGYAWSENIGWISFNNSTGGGLVNYGVNVDETTGYLSGYAWSENIGWISFNRSNTGVPPSSDPCPGGECIAKYNDSTKELNGWMRVLANGGGWDGWIKFYNATFDTNGDWHGYAWSDMVVGWISLNSAEGGGSSYRVNSMGVVNQPPTATNLNVTGGDSAYYCGSSPAHYFSWIYSDLDGHSQTRFQFQVDNNSDFSSPEINRDYINLSNPSPTTNNQTATIAVSPGSDQIGYNTAYYWRVKVYDFKETNSGWVSGSSFTTKPHLYPLVDFNWTPENPSQEENILFVDQTICYGVGNNPVSCTGWSWIFQDGNPATSNEQNPIMQFVSGGSKDISLETTDANGYSCPDSKNLEVGITLPDWREILPW